MIPFLFFLALLSGVQTTPAHPTVGDCVVVELPVDPQVQVSVDPSTDFELLSISGNRVTLRSFKPGPITLAARLNRPGQVPVTENFAVQIESVLKKGDALKPAPLKPPRVLEPSSIPRQMLIAAAVAAALLWIVLWLVARRSQRSAMTPEQPALPAEEEMLRSLGRIASAERGDPRWVELAQALRRYLSRTDYGAGTELTTSELLVHLQSQRPPEEIALIRSILDEGDWVKFSGHRRRRDDHEILAAAARSLVRPVPQEQAA